MLYLKIADARPPLTPTLSPEGRGSQSGGRIAPSPDVLSCPLSRRAGEGWGEGATQ